MSTLADLKSGLAQVTADTPVSVTIAGNTNYVLTAGDLDTPLGVTPKQPTIAYQARVTADATPGLHVRATPNGTITGAYAPGDIVDVLSDPAVQAGSYTWLKTRGVNRVVGSATFGKSIIGWCASRWLKHITPAAPRLVGLHCLQDSLNQVIKFLVSLPDGYVLPSATVLNEGGVAALLAEHTRYVIFRYTTGDPNKDDPQIPNDPAAATSYIEKWVAALMESGGIGALDKNAANNIYIQPWSEVKWQPSHNAAWIAAMRTIERYGFKAAIGAYAVGQPEPNEWAQLQPALEFAKASSHIVCLHAYCAPNTPVGQLSADGADYELRFARLFAAVPETARPTLIVSEFEHEFNRGNFEGIDALIRIAGLYRDAVKQYPYVGGFNLYTVGTLGGWETSSIDSALPKLAEWLTAQG